MSLREDIEALLVKSGRSVPSIDELMQDEHLRYQFFCDMLALMQPQDEIELVAVLLRDPDTTMSQAAITDHIDRRASTLPSCDAFATWAQRFGELIPQDSFPAVRITEWAIFKKVMEGSDIPLSDLGTGSDWLQRKLAAQAPPGNVLRTLAEVGRTKRVRNMAEARTRNLG